MKAAKLKSSARKVAQTPRALTSRKPASHSAAPQASATTAVRKLTPAAATPRDLTVNERVLQALVGEVDSVSIAQARDMMPTLVKSSASGRTFLIRNARTPDAPAAVLIGVAELSRVAAEPVGTRTLGEVLSTLPFSGMELMPPKAPALPGAGLPTALVPR